MFNYVPDARRLGKVVVCAVMRKLVRLLFGVLKHGRPFDPEWIGPTRAQGPGQASGGEELASLQLASPPVATA